MNQLVNGKDVSIQSVIYCLTLWRKEFLSEVQILWLWANIDKWENLLESKSIMSSEEAEVKEIRY